MSDAPGSITQAVDHFGGPSLYVYLKFALTHVRDAGRAFPSFLYPQYSPAGTIDTTTWPSDVASSLTNFLLYLERDSFSPFLKY